MTDEDLFGALAILALIGCNFGAIAVWRRANRAKWYPSLAAGAAAAYVFLILIPEIETGHDFVGDRIHFVTLFGFVLFYALTVYFTVSDTIDREDTYAFELSMAAVYQFLLVFTLHENLPVNIWLAPIYVFGIGLHLVQQRQSMAEAIPRAQNLATTLVLVGALVAGWIVGLLTQFSELILDMLTALVAGSLMFRAFKDELSTQHRIAPMAFIAGALVVSLSRLAAG